MLELSLPFLHSKLALGLFLLLFAFALGLLVLGRNLMEFQPEVVHLQLVHLVGIGKRVRAAYVAIVAMLFYVASSHSTVAIHRSIQVSHVYALIAAVYHGGLHVSYRQLSSLLSAHHSRARLAYIYLKLCAGRNLAQILHLHHLAKIQIVRFGIAHHVFITLVEPEQELQAARSGV